MPLKGSRTVCRPHSFLGPPLKGHFLCLLVLAPRISKRAQTLFGQLTNGRYSRLTLGEDFTVHAGAQDEDTLHSALWRSEGTVDQLYLALRLAVAEELTPDAPLVLDDALARFDDRRLAAAMEILQEAAQSKQVILFTCHSREQACVQQ